MLGPKRKYFQNVMGKMSSKQMRKVEQIKPFGCSRALRKTHFGHFPRETDPYRLIGSELELFDWR